LRFATYIVQEWLVYDYVAHHFLGSVSPNAALRKTSAVFTG
jgi:DNA topoisomerase-3